MIDLSTIGVRVGYAFETTKGTRPTSYINIPGPKGIPEFNPEPNSGETTSLNNEEYTSYIPLLKDLGGSLGIGFGMSQELLDTWEDICDTDEANEANGLRTWLTIYHPQLDKGLFIPIKPARLGLSAMEVNSVWDTTVYFGPIGEPVLETAVRPTDPVSA